MRSRCRWAGKEACMGGMRTRGRQRSMYVDRTADMDLRGPRRTRPPSKANDVKTSAADTADATERDPSVDDPGFCATPGCPCDIGQGDCDGDAQCRGGLVCANDVGA